MWFSKNHRIISHYCILKGGNLYNSSNSSSLIKNDTRDVLRYGTGNVYGITNLETVQIGDLIAVNQSFVEAVSLNGFYYIINSNCLVYD